MPQRRRVCAVLLFVCCSVKLVPSLRRPGSDPLLLQPCVVFASALDAGGGSDLAHLLTLYGGGRENVVLLPHGVLEEVKVGLARAAVLQSTFSAQLCCLSCVWPRPCVVLRGAQHFQRARAYTHASMCIHEHPCFIRMHPCAFKCIQVYPCVSTHASMCINVRAWCA